MNIPHTDSSFRLINCSVITVSDTRTKNNDTSGQFIQECLCQNGHTVVHYEIVKDEPSQIESILHKLGHNSLLEAIVFSGGTGISSRDNTYDILSTMLEKVLPGFGEIFRLLSYQDIGSRAIASRATAGIYKGKLVFSLPGSRGAVELGMNKLIIPELIHLVTQITQDK